MVGTAPDGQLNAAAFPPRARVRFAVATPADDSAIRRLLRENPLPGAVRLTLEREPDYFRGTNLAGAADRTIVAFEADRLICVGRCSTRRCWVNGQAVRAGYLGELRLDASARGRFDVLKGGYRFFRGLEAGDPAAVYFTSISADNHRARQLLERGLPGLPGYEFAGALTTLLVATRDWRRSKLPLEAAPADEIADFLNASAARHQFAAAWSAETVASLARHDLRADDFRVLRRHGRIAAVAALWDQRRFRQVVIRDYSPALALARPLINVLAPLSGAPTLPARGGALSHAFLSPVAIAPESAADFPEIVSAFLPHAAAQGVDYLSLALPAGDPRIAALRYRFHCRTYASRIYCVRWRDEAALRLDGRQALPDISLL